MTGLENFFVGRCSGDNLVVMYVVLPPMILWFWISARLGCELSSVFFTSVQCGNTHSVVRVLTMFAQS